MKINDILTEAEIDQLLAGTNTTAPQAGQQRDANGRYATQISQTPKLDATANFANIAAKSINKVSSAISNAGGKSYGSSFVQPSPTKKSTTVAQAAPKIQPGKVAPENAEYLRTVASNKVATQGTDSPEINAVLKSAGLLK